MKWLQQNMNVPNFRMNPDVAAGLLFVALGGWFGGGSVLGLEIGTAFRMGPGFFPAVVGGVLVVLGLLIALHGWRSAAPEAQDPVPWRAVVLIPTGLVLFGLAMRPLGLLPALLVLCFLAALSTGRLSLVRATAASVAMTALCIGIFSFGLGISLPLIGDWLR
jgi:hypothetical protein